MALSIDRALLKAKSLAKRGDIPNAEKIYRSILEKYPANKRALSALTALGLSGQEITTEPPQHELAEILALYNQGAYEKVWMECQELAARYPQSVVILDLLGAAFVGLEKFEQAADCFRRLLEIKPDYAEGHKNLGYALKALGRLADAAACYTKALELEPDSPAAHYNLAVTLHEASDHDGAIERYELALRLDPADVEIPNNLGVLFEETGRHEEAMACYRKALALDNASAVPHYNLGRVLQKLHRDDEAIEQYGKAIEIDPGCAEALDNLGVMYQELNRCDESIACLTKALRINPDLVEAHFNLGNTFQAVARADEAADCYRRALAIRPGFGEAHYNLSKVKKYEPGAPHIAQMAELTEQPDVPEKDKAYLHFALGKAFDDIGDYARAFFHFQEGNRLFRAKLDYHLADDRRLFDALKSAFSNNAPVRDAADLPVAGKGQKPIFIVGMPRSGTTLVEQILAAHSQIYGAGELRYLREMIGETDWSSSGPNMEAIRNIRVGYLAEISRISGSEPYVTDKLPLNFRWLGFIVSAFPEARIVHVRRDARAICWSIFKHCWPLTGNQYAYDLREIAEYHKMYQDLMAFWHQAFPGRIYDLTYERLTESQEPETRKLLEFIGIDLEEACLNFHESSRAVRTASSLQVRQQIYRRSSEEWQKYAPYLTPMFEVLDSR